MITIRLSRCGKKNKPSYRINVSESKLPINGKFIENIGFYNAFNKNKFNININRLKYWKNNGAKISNRIKFLVKKYKNLLTL